MTVTEFEEYERLAPEEFQDVRTVLDLLSCAFRFADAGAVDVALHEDEGYAIISTMVPSLTIYHENMSAFCDVLGKTEWLSVHTETGDTPMVCSFLVKLTKT